jgi:hypothetical protein
MSGFESRATICGRGRPGAAGRAGARLHHRLPVRGLARTTAAWEGRWRVGGGGRDIPARAPAIRLLHRARRQRRRQGQRRRRSLAAVRLPSTVRRDCSGTSIDASASRARAFVPTAESPPLRSKWQLWHDECSRAPRPVRRARRAVAAPSPRAQRARPWRRRRGCSGALRCGGAAAAATARRPTCRCRCRCPQPHPNRLPV